MKASSSTYAKKSRRIRKAGKKMEREFFGKGGPLEVKTNPTHWQPPQPWETVARSRFTKDEFILSSDGNVYARTLEGWVNHGTLEEFTKHAKAHWKPLNWVNNPLKASSHSSINEVDYMKSHGWDLIIGTRKQPKVYSRTIGSDFQTIQKEARYYRLLNKGFLNTELQSVGEFPLLTDAIIRADKVGTRKELFQKNPITVVGLANPQDNPPRSVSANIEGIIYNRCIEIRAEKTGYKAGFYKHPFSKGSQVCIYALSNGDLLVHSKAGVKLWQPD